MDFLSSPLPPVVFGSIVSLQVIKPLDPGYPDSVSHGLAFVGLWDRPQIESVIGYSL